MVFSALPTRYLDQRELAELVQTLAARPDLWSGMRARGIPFERLAQWMCAAPAKLVGLAHRKGAIAVGHDADLVVWSPEQEFTVRAADLLQRHPLTPYAGRSLAGVVHATYLRGERVFAQGSGIVASGHGQMLYREEVGD